MGILPAFVAMHQMHALTTEARRGQQIPWKWSHRPCVSYMRVLGIESRASARTASALDCELPLQPPDVFT